MTSIITKIKITNLGVKEAKHSVDKVVMIVIKFIWWEGMMYYTRRYTWLLKYN